MAFAGSQTLGSLLVGVLASPGRLGAAWMVALGSMGCRAGAAAFAAYLPTLRKLLRPMYVQQGILSDGSIVDVNEIVFFVEVVFFILVAFVVFEFILDVIVFIFVIIFIIVFVFEVFIHLVDVIFGFLVLLLLGFEKTHGFFVRG